LLLTRVRRDVFPEPLGPIKRMDGNVVRPLLRKTTEWRKMGIVIARRIAIAKPRGEGFRRACTKSFISAMTPGWQGAAAGRSCHKGCRVLIVVWCCVLCCSARQGFGASEDRAKPNPLSLFLFLVLSLAPYASAGDLFDTVCTVSSIA
jgi:hypothetical protein